MANNYDAEVLGISGAPVLLLPGGAATSRGFFPRLERLPGHRIVLVDRPGTGRAIATGPATMAGGADVCALVLRETGCAPAVVVGQSLGGAVAVQLAIDHPEVVRGLVLIDPTPFNDALTCWFARSLLEVLAAPTRLPRVGTHIERVLWRSLAVGVNPSDDEARASLDVLMRSASLAATARAVRTLVSDGGALTTRLRPLDCPVVLLTAERRSGHRVRRAHEQMARSLGGRLEAWPGAAHVEHLRNPDEIAELVKMVSKEATDR